jgi:hypothetical protein
MFLKIIKLYALFTPSQGVFEAESEIDLFRHIYHVFVVKIGLGNQKPKNCF